MIKIIQFGEGNFLRSFVDLYFDTLNKESIGEYEVHIVKPISHGSLENFYKQKNIYHVIERGFIDGKVVENVNKVTCVKQVINLSSDSLSYFDLAKDKEVKLLVSNTTEAGICFNENDKFNDLINCTYPAKLTMWLFERFKAGCGGIHLLPVELIDHNAETLYECVDKYISLWNLGEDFRSWNNKENFYSNTLVDRIVSGHPRDKVTQDRIDSLLKEDDVLSSICEPFGLWVIENKGHLSTLIKDGHHNIQVLLVDDISYYKKRKVRVLNGSHTNLVPISLIHHKETVFDVMQDKKLRAFVENTLDNDIIPFVDKDVQKTKEFANSVLERFLNPFLNHQLTSIALNSISKWKARDLPSFIDYYRQKGELPKYLTIGFAYLIHLYSLIEVKDNVASIDLGTRVINITDESIYYSFFKNNSLHSILADESLWGIDLSKFEGLEETLSKFLDIIKSGGSLL